LLVVAGGALALAGCGASEPGASTSAVPTKTAAAQRTTLTSRENVAGTLGYAGSRPVFDRLAARMPGTVTSVAAEGARRTRGQELYRLDGQSVRLLYGMTPAYRSLGPGAKGPDVKQLERNLRALGYDPGDVDRTYDADTAAAVRKWQKHVGWARTGRVALGQVVFLPGPRRIGDVTAARGDLVAGGAKVMTTTTPHHAVTVDLDAQYQDLVHRGDDVVITLPDGDTTKGHVSAVGRVAQATPGDDPGSSDATAATIALRIALDDDAAAARLDGAPVTVGLASEVTKDALAVPVTALLARTGGGYAVDVVTGATTKRVPVKVGQFADGLVAITGGDLQAGDRVVVPDGV
jgi:peptidoglycan hydrolase-like protein with peptidoglycan-binding domain